MGRLSLKDSKERKRVAEAIVAPIVRAKRDRTVRSSYERLKPSDTGRIHTVPSPIGTATFRLSSSETKLLPSTNLQNLANKVAKLDPLYHVRDCIIPDPGYVLVAADFSGAEAICIGAYSRDWEYVDRLLAGEDTHTTLATAFYGPEIKPVYRDIAKMIRYASSYYAKVPTIQQKLNKDADITGIYFTFEELFRLHSILLQLHPLERWWQEVREGLVKSNGVIVNCFGYTRTLYDPDPDERLKKALANLPQSTIAWLINLAMKYWKEHKIPDVRLLLQLHDELIWQAREEAIPRLQRLMTPVFEQPFQIHDHELHIPAEWKMSHHSWGSMAKLPEIIRLKAS